MKNKKLFIGIGIIILVAAGVLCGLFNNSIDPKEKAIGEWLRTDGPYTINVIELLEDGTATTEYFNPQKKINIGRSAWRVNENVFQIYVELQDENYPGSIYQLSYSEELDLFSGTYFQAVSRQTFEVEFKRK